MQGVCRIKPWPMAIIVFNILLLGTMSVKAAELEISIKGIIPGQGELIIALFNSEDGFPVDMSEDRVVRSATPDSPNITLRLEGLTEGTWAVVVLQDLNGNSELDTNFLGWPREPYGVSNNRLPRRSMPAFDDSSFVLTDERKSMDINMRLP